MAAARRFFKRAICTDGVPDRIVIDKSGANLAGLQAANVILKFTGNGRTVEARQIKCLSNILEQDHRFIERITAPMMGFKAFHSAAATIAGVQAAHIICKGQIPANGATTFQTFSALAEYFCPQLGLLRHQVTFAMEPAGVFRFLRSGLRAA